MRKKEFTRSKRSIGSGTPTLKWTSDTVSSLARRGYIIRQVRYDELESTRQFRITIWYSGNIFQRIWRKLTQW